MEGVASSFRCSFFYIFFVAGHFCSGVSAVELSVVEGEKEELGVSSECGWRLMLWCGVKLAE